MLHKNILPEIIKQSVRIGTYKGIIQLAIDEHIDIFDDYRIKNDEKMWNIINTKSNIFLSNNFIIKYQNKMDWKKLARYKILNEIIIEKFETNFTPYWKIIEQNQNISDELKKAHMDKLYKKIFGKVINRKLNYSPSS